MSKSDLLEGSCIQSRATGTCSKEDACNHEQVGLARGKLHPIMSKSDLFERSRVPSRATGTCSKENALNHEQVANAHNKVAEKPHLVDSLKNGRSQKV